MFGILLAYGLTFPNRPVLIYFLFPIPAKYFVMIYGLMELYSSLSGGSPGVAHWAHVGGLVTGLILLIGGDVGSGVEDILIQGSALVSLSYTRDAEAEADRFSVELMHRTGHDPFAIARFLELIRDKLGDTSENDFLSTHPATPARIEETKRYAEELAGSPAN